MALRSCDPFDVSVSGDISAVLARLRASIVAGGGSFAGDASAGRFHGQTPVGTVEGTYAVNGNVVRITITQKPMLAPCGAIEARIRGYFG